MSQRIVKDNEEHLKLVKNMLERVLEWRNPQGKIKNEYIPAWLATDAELAIKGIISDKEYLQSLKNDLER